MDAFDDIRNQLRRDHESSLAELDDLRAEVDDHCCRSRLEKVRRSWKIHALAEEAVVYRALEGAVMAADSAARADERFAEHKRVAGVFDRIAASRPRSIEWNERVSGLRGRIARHIEAEHCEIFARLAERFDTEELCDMGSRFLLARDKLTLLESAKAA